MIARFMDGPLMGKEQEIPSDGGRVVEIEVAEKIGPRIDLRLPDSERMAAPSYRKARYRLVHVDEAGEGWYASETMDRLRGIWTNGREGNA